VIANLHLPHDVPDQLETDLGDADAGVKPGPGDRQCHIGRRLAAQINRAVISLFGYRVGEFGVVRVVLLVFFAWRQIHDEPRDPQPLLARGVESSARCASDPVGGEWKPLGRTRPR
jgi:hypothetical protein